MQAPPPGQETASSFPLTMKSLPTLEWTTRSWMPAGVRCECGPRDTLALYCRVEVGALGRLEDALDWPGTTEVLQRE
jgi:hypothetical protein